MAKAISLQENIKMITSSQRKVIISTPHNITNLLKNSPGTALSSNKKSSKTLVLELKNNLQTPFILNKNESRY